MGPRPPTLAPATSSAPTVLIAAVSARALAVSALRAGWPCISVDAFGDLDLPIAARADRASTSGPLGSGLRGGSASALARSAAAVPADAVVYGAPFENAPGQVERLAAGRQLWGTPPAGLRGVRNPARLARVLRDAEVPFPGTLTAAQAAAADPRQSWIRKPRRGGGGRGIAPWRPGEPVRGSEIVQQRVVGRPASAMAAGDGREAVLLGLSRQLLGRPAFGVSGFRWCGNLYPLEVAPAEERMLLETLQRAAAAVADAFGVRGLFGLDFVHAGGRAVVVEVNPRPTASMELLEERDGLSVFDAHVRASRGALPSGSERMAGRGRGVVGKAILFTARPLAVHGSPGWSRFGARDLPAPGARLPSGAPLCSVVATAADARSCLRALERRAARVRQAALAATAGGGTLRRVALEREVR